MGEGVTYSPRQGFGGERWEARVSLRVARVWGFLGVTVRRWSAVDRWQSSLQLGGVAEPEKQGGTPGLWRIHSRGGAVEGMGCLAPEARTEGPPHGL